jgi:YVTN family beta-propeller protein
VIDAITDRVVGRIVVGKRPRGLKVAPDGRFLYVALSGSPKAPPGVDPASIPPADRAADGIGMVDLATGRLARVIAAGRDPEAFDLSRDGRRLWVSNEETAEASLVDLAAGGVVGRVPVGDEPEGVTVHPDGQVVYVTNEEDNSIAVIDADTMAEIARIDVCARPRAVAFTPDGSRAFATCETAGAIAVVDARAHRHLLDVPLPGTGVRPMGLAMSADGRTLFISGGRGRTVHVFDTITTRVQRTVADVGTRPWGIALTPDGRKLYSANGSSGDVSVIDAETGSVVGRIAVGGSPWGVAIH